MTASKQIHVGVGALLGLAAAYLTTLAVDVTTGEALLVALVGVSVGSVGGWRASVGDRRRRS